MKLMYESVVGLGTTILKAELELFTAFADGAGTKENGLREWGRVLT